MQQPRSQPLEPAAPSALPATTELLVVGGGLAGLIAAWRGAAAGLRTVVLDAPDRPAAAGVAAGMIAPAGEAHWGEERLLDAGLSAAASWPGFAAELGDSAGVAVPYRRCGALHVALDRDEAAELRRRDPLLERSGLESETLLASAARRLEPALSPAVSAATLVPEEAEVDPRALLRALSAAARAAGARLFGATVASVGAAGLVRTERGEPIEADRVVLAAGAWAGAAELLGDRPRLQIRPVKGAILRLRSDPDLGQPCRRIIVGERFYLVPRASGELVLGASSEDRGFDLRVTAGAVHELLREACRALPELAELELVETAAGLRPGSPDNEPIFGPLPDSRVLVAAGLYRNGVLLSPLLARGFDAIFAAEPPPQALAGLGPGERARPHDGILPR